MTFIHSLNEKQQQAVKYIVKPLIINAGPGTGKTKTLIAKILYLINEKKFNPRKILTLTFTNKACNEIQDRIKQAINIKIPGIYTFHALSYEILNKYSGKKFNIISEKQKKDIIEELIENKFTELSYLPINEVLLNISKSKIGIDTGFPRMDKLLSKYSIILDQMDSYDYDDLLTKANNILQLDKYRVYDYILIDEFQDTNNLQLQIICNLLKEMDNITVIGDPKQAIYSFRGSDPTIFQKFKSLFPGCKELTLDINYRSSQNLINASRDLFPESGKLQAYSKSTGSVKYIKTLNRNTEADYIVEDINKKIGGGDFNRSQNLYNKIERITFSDFAILYRAHNISFRVEKKLEKSGFPYQIIGGRSIYETCDIDFICSFLKYIYHNTNEYLIMLLGSRFFKLKLTAVNKLRKYKDLVNCQNRCDLKTNQILEKILKINNSIKNTQKDLEVLINIIITSYNIKDCPSLNIFLNSTYKYIKQDHSLSKFIKHLELLESNNYFDPDADKITLMTMHAAKGLEFEIVYIIGVEQGNMPLIHNSKNYDINEEKRLFYVAISRAKRECNIFFTKEKKRNLYNQESEFIKLFASGNVDIEQDGSIQKVENRRNLQKQKKSQIKLF